MDQLRKLFGSLSVSQRIGIAVVVLLLVGGTVSFVRWRHESDFKPLFTGMPAEDAAAIVQRLKESGVEHRLEDNGTSVLVPTDRVDELRLEMAGAGLPRSGRIGFELFDKTNIGLTDFTEHVNYRRALEGELERSIRSLNEVEQARVHLSFPKESVFLDARETAKASVLLSLKPGARLSDQNVLAITNLVASAVEGLGPEYVSVVDARGNLLSRPKKSNPDLADSADGALEYKHQLEKDLVAKIQSTLTPLLGEDHFRVGISADCDFSTSELTDETYDPTRSVMTNSQKTEDVAGRRETAGVPGTASNLPRSTLQPVSTGNGNSSVSRRTENTSYETSRTVRQTKVPRGIIKRLSAAILIDNEVKWEGVGAKAKRTVVAPSAEKLKTIHDIVGGIIGLSTERGDQLIVQSLPFEKDQDDLLPGPAKPEAPLSTMQKLLHDPKVLIGGGVGALLLVGLALFLLTRGKKASAPAPAIQAALPAGTEAATEKELAIAAVEDKAHLTGPSQEFLAAADMGVRIENLRKSVREAVGRDPVLAAGVVRGWLTEESS